MSAFLFTPPNLIGDRTFVFWGKPHPKERPRRSKQGHFYDPQTNRLAEGELVKQLDEHYPDTPRRFEGPVQVKCYFMYPKPKNWFPGKYKAKPDIDNLIKTVCDAFNGVLWLDDSQIVGKLGEKAYWDEQNPGTVIQVYYFMP